MAEQITDIVKRMDSLLDQLEKRLAEEQVSARDMAHLRRDISDLKKQNAALLAQRARLKTKLDKTLVQIDAALQAHDEGEADGASHNIGE